MRVLVTRPKPGASETAARLEALGHEPVVLPLTEIQPVAVREMPEAGAIDAVAITSANAVRHTPDEVIAALSRKPCFAVGERTAEAARGAGFSALRSADGDAAGLARQIAAEMQPETRIAYLCGRVRRPEFEAALAASGFKTIAIETYDTVLADLTAQAALDRLGNRPVQAALVYSAAGAQALAALALDASTAQALAGTRYFCLSARIAEALPATAAERVIISPEPSEAALLSLIGTGQAANSFS